MTRKFIRMLSQFINLASHSNLRIGTNLELCTTKVQLASESTLDGSVILIDTPGFDDTLKSDTYGYFENYRGFLGIHVSAHCDIITNLRPFG